MVFTCKILLWIKIPDLITFLIIDLNYKWKAHLLLLYATVGPVPACAQCAGQFNVFYRWLMHACSFNRWPILDRFTWSSECLQICQHCTAKVETRRKGRRWSKCLSVAKGGPCPIRFFSLLSGYITKRANNCRLSTQQPGACDLPNRRRTQPIAFANLKPTLCINILYTPPPTTNRPITRVGFQTFRLICMIDLETDKWGPWVGESTGADRSVAVGRSRSTFTTRD